MERTRYCQRCGKPQTLANIDQPNPCRGCGGTNFAEHPKKHAGRGYELTPERWREPWRGAEDDAWFLRAIGVDPED